MYSPYNVCLKVFEKDQGLNVKIYNTQLFLTFRSELRHLVEISNLRTIPCDVNILHQAVLYLARNNRINLPPLVLTDCEGNYIDYPLRTVDRLRGA